MVVFIGWFLFFCTFDPWALAFRRARETRVAAGKYHAMIRMKIHHDRSWSDLGHLCSACYHPGDFNKTT